MSPDPDCRHCGGSGYVCECIYCDHAVGERCGCDEPCSCDAAPVCIGCGATVPREGDECGRCDGYDDRPADSIEAALLARVSSRPKRAPYGVIPALGRVDVEPCS